jgi:hypothetical protein
MGVFAFGVAAVVLVTGLVAFLALRRRPPAMVGAYAMAGVPNTAVPEAVTLPGGTYMSPDGNYWWDGQSWRDATTDNPPDAQRSDDGAYWWDGRSWRPVAQSPPPQTPTA